MARTVKVNLDVDEQPYVRGVERAEKATERLDDAVDDLGGTAKTTTAGMGQAKDTIGDTGDKARESAGDFDRLGDEIKETERRVKDLAAEIRRVGPDADLLKKFGAERSGLAKLQAVQKTLRGIGDEVKSSSRLGLGPGGLFASFNLSGIVAAAGPALLAAGAPIAAGLATLVGAGVAGGITAGITGGAIAAGIASAADDPAVEQAWALLSVQAEDIFTGFGAPFVEPAVEGIGEIRKALAAAEGDIEHIGQVSATFVGPLAGGAGSFLTQAVEGLDTLVSRAKPVMDELSDELPELGAAVKQAFTDIGDGAEGGAEALGLILDIAEGAIVGTGKILGFLGEAYDKAEDLVGIINQPGVGVVQQAFEDRNIRLVKRALDDTAASADQLKFGVRSLSDAFSDWLGISLNAEELADDFKLRLLELDDAVHQNGKSLSDNTEGGLRNQQVIRDMIELADRQRQAEIDRAGGTEEAVARANTAYQSNIQKIIEAGVKAGLSRKELENMAGTYNVNIYMTNLDKMIGQVRALGSALRSLPASLPGVGLAGAVIGGLLGRAAGGPVVGAGPKGIDSVPAMLAPGEFVLRAAAVDRIGMSNLARLNAGLPAAAGAYPVTVAPEIRVFLGDRELTDIVRVEMSEHDRGLRRRATAGVGGVR